VDFRHGQRIDPETGTIIDLRRPRRFGWIWLAALLGINVLIIGSVLA
jgi:hypothetical protein